MTDWSTPHHAGADERISELTLLYQFSNTLLSTIRLNKLIHLSLSALTARSSGLFERSMLFLRNEKSAMLQGMLGVTRLFSEELQIVGDQDGLGSRWEISDEVIALQRSSDFCAQIRATRIEIDCGCPLIKRVMNERTLCYLDDLVCRHCSTCHFIRRLCDSYFAAVPLIARNSTIGIIIVDNPESGNEISRSQLHFLQLFTSQAGMAIENSMLYNRIEDANANLRDARERLLHGERMAAIGEMTANLAHELKNPIITIGGFAGRLLKALPEETREHRYADTIVTEVQRLEKMLADTLAFSRKPTICFSECDAGEIIQDSLSSCATALEDGNIVVKLANVTGSWPILGDPYQLKQVFLNLILNACDAMPDGGHLSVSLDKLPGPPSSVRVNIEDSGGGVPKDMLAHIFSPFFTTKQHGTGLGLAIANRIVLNHYGIIEASNSGQGAVFRVTFPLAEGNTFPLSGASGAGNDREGNQKRRLTLPVPA
ncbi:MAG TPA: GAF domain-containing protein [Desulfuromonadales bacterium]|nr:GAF domain-containing protein [Desulfuromonadales bacterium]